MTRSESKRIKVTTLPVPLKKIQRASRGILWIVKQSEKRQGKKFGERLAMEVIAVLNRNSEPRLLLPFHLQDWGDLLRRIQTLRKRVSTSPEIHNYFGKLLFAEKVLMRPGYTNIQDKQCVANCDNPDVLTHKYFEQPVWQTLNMFIGEFCCLIEFHLINWFKRNYNKVEIENSRKGYRYSSINNESRESVDEQENRAENERRRSSSFLLPDQLVQPSHLSKSARPFYKSSTVGSPWPRASFFDNFY
ncbi:hypothetical protein PPACK8108_LOCUS15561 [Phakopsora pachyrhizi]|uniref:Small ribosomal subunit protein uS7 domain-containing protein n=1 Tax=Phakopsora pachyrhizi TaxID=170000 RepID=A0AAV0BAC8_PHAPC|nr:hypothetical protein PPACK8108_LOCUS15561 [Phakopsora pachyrhizi]